MLCSVPGTFPPPMGLHVFCGNMFGGLAMRYFSWVISTIRTWQRATEGSEVTNGGTALNNPG
jgi:hypothetical protein